MDWEMILFFLSFLFFFSFSFLFNSYYFSYSHSYFLLSNSYSRAHSFSYYYSHSYFSYYQFSFFFFTLQSPGSSAPTVKNNSAPSRGGQILFSFTRRKIPDARKRKQYLPTPAWGDIVLDRWRRGPGARYSLGKGAKGDVFPAQASREKHLFRIYGDRMIE